MLANILKVFITKHNKLFSRSVVMQPLLVSAGNWRENVTMACIVYGLTTMIK